MFFNKRNVILYILVGGFAAYLITSALSSIFIIPIEMEKNWCLDTMKFEGRNYSTEVICTEFKNKLEETKFFHNSSMVERNSNLHLGVFFLFFGVSSLLFYFIPKWQGKLNVSFNNFFIYLLVINLAIVYIVSGIIGDILPPPIDWFPDFFEDIRSKLLKATREELEDIASLL